MTAFHFVTIVWGRTYTRAYLDLILPTQLSPGNLPAFKDDSRSAYIVYTTSEDAPAIRADARFIQVSRHLSTQIIEFAPSAEDLNFDTMVACHRQAVIQANAAAAVFVALCPDAIFSDGSFAALRRLHDQGKRLVLLPGLRASLESFSAALPETATPDSTGAIILPPRALMRLALDNLHPISQSLFWNATTPTSLPSHLYWWARAESPRALLAHCFHLHPLLVDPESKNIQPSSSIDDDYVNIACPNSATHHVVTDSDEIACVELSRMGFNHDLVSLDRSKISHVARWSLAACNKTHLKVVRQPIHLHDGPAPPSSLPIVSEARDVVARIKRRIPYEKLRVPLEHFYISCVYFCKRIGNFFRQSWRWFLGVDPQHQTLATLVEPQIFKCIGDAGRRAQGWIYETDLQDQALAAFAEPKAQGILAYRLKACWPFDLFVIYGRVINPPGLQVRAELSGRVRFEKIIPAENFRWVLPASFSLGPILRLATFPANRRNDLFIKRLIVWRAPLHHLRHNYRSGRPDPLWLEWDGLSPGHCITGPCTVRVIPHWGVKSLRLDLQKTADSAYHSLVLPLDPRQPGQPLEVNLPGVHRLLAVSCRERLLWRIFKQCLQIPHTIATAIFTSRPQRGR